jgi:hypothetical protein
MAPLRFFDLRLRDRGRASVHRVERRAVARRAGIFDAVVLAGLDYLAQFPSTEQARQSPERVIRRAA